jgi:hypothetical protein
LRFVIIKIGARISDTKLSEKNGEALEVGRLLADAGHSVTFSCIPQPGDVLTTRFTWANPASSETHEADVVLCVNGKLRISDDAVEAEDLQNYRLMHDFGGPIFYLYTDTLLTLADLPKLIRRRLLDAKYDAAQLDLSNSDITLISQGSVAEANLRFHNVGDTVKLKKAVHFPLHYLFVPEYRWGARLAKKYDLIYGGGMRQGQRVNDIKNYFNTSTQLLSHIFGKHDHAEPPATFGAKVDWDAFISTMSQGLATCFIGDGSFPSLGHVTLRPLESIIAGCVTFCAPLMDPDNRIFDPTDWLRVLDHREFHDKVSELKRQPNRVVELQARQRRQIDRLLKDVDFPGWLVKELGFGVSRS